MPVVTVTLWSGRSDEQKRELARAITESMVNIIQVRKENVQVIFEEIDKNNWAIGGEIPNS